MVITYVMLPETICLTIDGTLHYIPSSDAKYNKVKSLISEDDLETAASYINDFEKLGVEGISLKKGVAHFEGSLELPPDVSKFIASKHSLNELSALEKNSFRNYFLNKSKRGENFTPEEIECLVRDSYPASDDGFYFYYNHLRSDKKTTKIVSECNTFYFLNLNIFPRPLKKLLGINEKSANPSITDIAEKIFGIRTKRARLFVQDSLFKSENPGFSIILAIMLLKTGADTESTIAYLKDNQDKLTLGNYDLRNILRDNSLSAGLEFAGIFKSSLLKRYFLETGGFARFTALAERWEPKKGKIQFDPNFTTVKELTDFLDEKIRALDQLDFEFNQKAHYPFLKKLDGLRAIVIENEVIYLKKKSKGVPPEAKLIHFEVPSSMNKLRHYSQVMGNCIGTSPYYANQALRGERFLLGVYVGGELTFNIEASLTIDKKVKIQQFEKRGKVNFLKEEKESVVKIIEETFAKFVDRTKKANKNKKASKSKEDKK